MKPPESGVKVRMYNTGFGDCFLLAFRAEDDRARYMLIDFGIHHLYPDSDEIMPLIAKDIKEATGNRLHVVAVTHEHTDHLYGFKHARDDFNGIEIDELWLAWTEDPNNTVAKKLKEKYGMRLRALHSAVNQLTLANDPLANALRRLPEFETPEALGVTTGGNAAQIEYLRTKSKKELERPEDYRHPDETPQTMPDVKGVKIYILGPPENVDWIKKLTRKSEMYPELTEMNEMVAFAAAVLAAEKTASVENEDEQLFRQSRPFDKSLGIPKDEADQHSIYKEFFKEHYGFSKKAGDDLIWRRIDTDWLGVAEELALSINSKTNNTSLVFAIELTETQPRRVLLFAGDAQVGNWLSWHELSWSGEGEDGVTVTTADLLQRTVFYKVGHHGSRNATLSRKGLEMMESSDLVAMIPVNEDWANNKMGWEHPAEKLLDRLKEKTRGRIIRMDGIPEGDEPPKRPDEATETEWQDFIRRLDWDRGEHKLWIQYTVPG